MTGIKMGGVIVRLARRCDECAGLDRRPHLTLHDELDIIKEALHDLKTTKLNCC